MKGKDMRDMEMKSRDMRDKDIKDRDMSDRWTMWHKGTRT